RTGPYARVHDAFESGARLRIGKDDPAERGPVERAVGSEHAFSERRHDLVEARRARLDHLARQQIGVDDHGAQLCEPPRDSALSASDAAGQTPHPHARTIPSGPRTAFVRSTGAPASVRLISDLSCRYTAKGGIRDHHPTLPNAATRHRGPSPDQRPDRRTSTG